MDKEISMKANYYISAYNEGKSEKPTRKKIKTRYVIATCLLCY